MLVKLVGNSEKIAQYNNNLGKMVAKFGGGVESTNADSIMCKNSIDDFFMPLSKIEGFMDAPEGFYVSEDISGEFNLEYADIAELNGGYFEEVRCNYGVCDNHKQILDYYKEQLPLLLENRDRKFVILMTPVPVSGVPSDDDWLLHEMGRYIGRPISSNQDSDTEDVDRKVFCYSIIEVEEI